MFLLLLGLVPLDYLEGLMDFLGMIGDRFLIEGECGEPHWEFEEFIILVSLLNDEGMHLPEDECCRLACHVLRADAVLDGIGRIRVLFHLENAAPWKRHCEAPIREAVVLASKREP